MEKWAGFLQELNSTVTSQHKKVSRRSKVTKPTAILHDEPPEKKVSRAPSLIQLKRAKQNGKGLKVALKKGKWDVDKMKQATVLQTGETPNKSLMKTRRNKKQLNTRVRKVEMSSEEIKLRTLALNGAVKLIGVLARAEAKRLEIADSEPKRVMMPFELVKTQRPSKMIRQHFKDLTKRKTHRK